MLKIENARDNRVYMSTFEKSVANSIVYYYFTNAAEIRKMYLIIVLSANAYRSPVKKKKIKKCTGSFVAFLQHNMVVYTRSFDFFVESKIV